MKWLRTLIESVNMLDRIPAQDLLLNEGGCAANRIEATRGKDYVFIYSAAGDPISIRSEKLGSAMLNASWYDPRTGKTIPIGTYKSRDCPLFIPPLPVGSPVPSQKVDWVLVLKYLRD
jgi:Putative collagen-binding domain of a collagenase